MTVPYRKKLIEVSGLANSQNQQSVLDQALAPLPN
jgi:hypothetical protein